MNVVITGGSKGIGKAFATKFLSLGDKVVICSRSINNINTTVNEFKSKYSPDHIFGYECDVSNPQSVENYIKFAQETLGTIDIWINNAGIADSKNEMFIDTDPQTIKNVIETNILGTLYCCRAILNIMLIQGYGKIFNMEGMGSDGRTQQKTLLYVTSKAAIPMIKKSLILETKRTKIGIHDLNPGIVLTDLILKSGVEDLSFKKILNILAEEPKTVAEDLVPKIRKVKGTGKLIKFIPTIKVLWRFITAMKRRNRFFDKKGNFIN